MLIFLFSKFYFLTFGRRTENVAETKTEMSKNAQFRAIQPSPSILSFVEDNVLMA